jgi:hypothetical protein
MWNTNGAKFKHFLYNVERARIKSWNKKKNAVERHIENLKKEKAGKVNAKWVYKTKLKSADRLKRYWITPKMVENIIVKKWLKDLLTNDK